ncbi:MAG: hypothetical protein ACJ72N_26895 [Labedaea sp.]
MRLIRLGEGASEVGVDVRAALVSWGRGDAVVGGIALTGARPPDCPYPVDAIVLLPRGILVVVGVDLPDPAVRLDAPLTGQWKTDGWPLVRGDRAVNPAVEGLAAAAAIATRLEYSRVEPLPVSTVIAVGPYVSQVFQPTADLARGVRILHPEPMTLLNATRELAVYQSRCTVEGARRILAALDPATDGLDPAELAAEGFATVAFPALAAASTTVLPRVTDPARVPGPPSRRPRPAGQLRWLPVGAAILVALLMITGIVFAMTSAGSSTNTGNRNAAVSAPQRTPISVDGFAFEAKGANRAADCANHAAGEVRKWLQSNKCAELIRLRFESTIDRRKAAVLVAVVRFADPASATELRQVADTQGGGAIIDLAEEGTGWPDGGQPAFASAPQASGREGDSVKLVQAAWLDRPSTPDDTALRDLAARGLQLSVSE